jgi:hypothetical protein
VLKLVSIGLAVLHWATWGQGLSDFNGSSNTGSSSSDRLCRRAVHLSAAVCDEAATSLLNAVRRHTCQSHRHSC